MTSNRLLISHLTFIGPSSPKASIAFDDHLTVIVGPSDTGKSFIVDSIDYMLGKQKLRLIPEVEEYDTILLGLRISDGTRITLARDMKGGRFRCYLSDVRDIPSYPADFELASKHSSDNDKNLSNFLLTHIGLTNRHVRKNKNNVTRSLSFRDLAHLCVIDETQMQSPTPPAQPSSQVIHKTVEKSVLKLLLQGDDDSALTQVASEPERHFTRGKQAMVDIIVRHLLSDMTDTVSVDSLMAQQARLLVSLKNVTGSIERLLRSRSELVDRLRPLETELYNLQSRLAESGELIERFRLLQLQYEADLRRLEMMAEAGTLLTVFRPGVCVLCGAQEEHQFHNLQVEAGPGPWDAALEAEIRKTSSLSSDLSETITLMLEQQIVGALQSSELSEDIRALKDDIKRVDSELSPKSVSVVELTEKRSSLEKAIATFENVDQINGITSTVSAEVSDAPVVAPVLDESVLAELSEAIGVVLNRWSIPEARTVRIDAGSLELVVGGRERGSRGKGTRSVLHAAFTVALGEYCFERALEHPGFLVLDSPLVTYRSPDSPESEIELHPSVADQFYDDLSRRADGQFIVIENVEPTEGIAANLHLVRFTKQSNVGRYGLFPPRAGNSRRVRKAENDQWVVTPYGDRHTLVTTPTQEDAISAARKMLEGEGGGDILVFAGDGSFRESQTV